MANNKVTLADGTVLIDLTGDTVTKASDIKSGCVGHLSDGTTVTGTGNYYIYEDRSLDGNIVAVAQE